MINQVKQDVLNQALAAREEEVLHYQINIDNYRLAIDKADQDVDLIDFAKHLRDLLSSSILEQKKAIIMRDVIRDQLEG
jgi:hypothetical protein